jgi:hypothetical protein
MLDEKTIDELKAKHPGKELELIIAAGEDIVAFTPTRGDWDKFQAWIKDDNKRKLAFHDLAVACVVYPATSDLEALLDRKPAIAVTIGNQLAQMAGIDEAATRKKL